ncbi:MAG: stage II sporulation protein M [Eubacteriales bacterium]|nr:stage II sporulation protein M [Eubacteriales bacterium]
MIRNHGRVMVLFYMAGFLGGILYTNLVSKDYVAALGIFNDYFLNQYIQTDIADGSYLWYLIKVRLTPLLCIMFLGATRVRKLTVVVFLIWTGFLCGMIFTSATLKMGVKGIVLCLAALLPQMIFYVIGYAILLIGVYYYPKIGWNFQKTIAVLLAICIGIALECYMNPVLVKMFLKTV